MDPEERERNVQMAFGLEENLGRPMSTMDMLEYMDRKNAEREARNM